MLHYRTEKVAGNHDAFYDDKKSDTQDKPGWTRYEFKLGEKPKVYHNKKRFNFRVCRDNSKYDNAKIRQHLQIVEDIKL